MRTAVLFLAALGLALVASPAAASTSDAAPGVAKYFSTSGVPLVGSDEVVLEPVGFGGTDADETLKYDGNNSDGLGLTNGGTFHGAVRFTPAQTCTLKAVLFYHYDASTSDKVFVWAAGSETIPGAKTDSVAYNGADTMWIRVNLASPRVMTAGVDFWSGPRLTHAAGVFPMGMDAGPAVANRTFVELSGTWYELAGLGFNSNFNIRAIVARGGGAAHDVSANAILKPDSTMAQGSVAPKVRIRNLGSSAESNIPVYCWIDSAGTRVYNQTATFAGPLAAGATDSITMPAAWSTGAAPTLYNVTAFTALAADENRSNDTTRRNTRIISVTMQWTPVTQSPAPGRYWCPAVGNVRDTIWLVGGRSAAGATSTRLIYGYDAINDAWITTGVPNLSIPRRAGGGGLIGTKFYVAGGRDSIHNTLNTCEEFDVDAKTVAAKANMPAAIWSCGSAVAGGKLYMVGSEAYGTTNYAYDPAANTWATRAPIPVGRGWTAAAGAGGKVYVFGGIGTGSVVLGDCYAYDPVANTWAARAAMPGVRAYHSATAYQDSVIFVTGGTASTASPADRLVYKYHIAANAWTTETQMGTARGWHMLAEGAPSQHAIFALCGSDCTTPTYLQTCEKGVLPQTGVEEYRIEPTEVLSVATFVRGSGHVGFSLPRAGNVNLSVYNTSGRLVATLADGAMGAGSQTVTWDGTDAAGQRVARGTYFYRLSIDGKSVSAKAIVLE